MGFSKLSFFKDALMFLKFKDTRNIYSSSAFLNYDDIKVGWMKKRNSRQDHIVQLLTQPRGK